MSPKLYWIPNSSPGRVAISARPRGGDWLEDDIEGWQRQGVNVVVSLLTPSEVDELELGDEARLSRAKDISFFSFPIEDRGVPRSAAQTDELLSHLSSEMQHGKNIAVHCRQGIGRSSLISAALLISAGDDLDKSLRAITDARGLQVPETAEQREWLDQFVRKHVFENSVRHSR